MLKILSLFIAVFACTLIYAQESTYEYRYEFSIEGITESGTAKLEIETLRDLMGVQVVNFNDESDQFIVLTQHEFDVAELMVKLVLNGVNIEGEIVKIDLG